jgi:hypothetical protein
MPFTVPHDCAHAEVRKLRPLLNAWPGLWKRVHHLNLDPQGALQHPGVILVVKATRALVGNEALVVRRKSGTSPKAARRRFFGSGTWNGSFLVLVALCFAVQLISPSYGTHTWQLSRDNVETHENGDSISRAFERFFDWAGSLAPIHYRFLLRALLLFGAPCVFCAWAFSRGSRSVLVQSLCFAAGLLLAATIPVNKLTVSNPTLRGWLLVLGGTLLLFLPSILPALVMRTLGMQKKARVAGYVLLGVLFLANLVLARRYQ